MTSVTEKMLLQDSGRARWNPWTEGWEYAGKQLQTQAALFSMLARRSRDQISEAHPWHAKNCALLDELARGYYDAARFLHHGGSIW